MPSCTSVPISALILLFAVTSASAAPLHKCIVNGTVTYQEGPCPSGQVRKTPSIQELNAAEKRKREVAASSPTNKAGPVNPPVNADLNLTHF
ncbi:MAG: DUF4124 domain-containing protein, partial [Caldimonas sp.]